MPVLMAPVKVAGTIFRHMFFGETWLDMLSGADTPLALRGPAAPVKAAPRGASKRLPWWEQGRARQDCSQSAVSDAYVARIEGAPGSA